MRDSLESISNAKYADGFSKLLAVLANMIWKSSLARIMEQFVGVHICKGYGCIF